MNDEGLLLEAAGWLDAIAGMDIRRHSDEIQAASMKSIASSLLVIARNSRPVNVAGRHLTAEEMFQKQDVQIEPDML